MFAIDAGVKVNRGRAVTVPLDKGVARRVELDVAIAVDDGAVPRLTGVDHVHGLVHVGGHIHRVAGEIEVFDGTIQFHEEHIFELREMANRIGISSEETAFKHAHLAANLEAQCLDGGLHVRIEFAVELGDEFDHLPLFILERFDECGIHHGRSAGRVQILCMHGARSGHNEHERQHQRE